MDLVPCQKEKELVHPAFFLNTSYVICHYLTYLVLCERSWNPWSSIMIHLVVFVLATCQIHHLHSQHLPRRSGDWIGISGQTMIWMICRKMRYRNLYGSHQPQHTLTEVMPGWPDAAPQAPLRWIVYVSTFGCEVRSLSFPPTFLRCLRAGDVGAAYILKHQCFLVTWNCSCLIM